MSFSVLILNFERDQIGEKNVPSLVADSLLHPVYLNVCKYNFLLKFMKVYIFYNKVIKRQNMFPLLWNFDFVAHDKMSGKTRYEKLVINCVNTLLLHRCLIKCYFTLFFEIDTCLKTTDRESEWRTDS